MASLSPLQVLLALVTLLCLLKCIFAQFPTICNTPENLERKVCCPNNCNGNRGNCVNVTSEAERQSVAADQEIVAVLKNTFNVKEKGKRIDSRYLWPTMVFEKVCICSGKFYGVDCSECAFGWKGTNCETRTQVVRRSFGSLSIPEKENVKRGMSMLKSEMGYWSVVIEEPLTVSGRVTLQDVSTYDFLVYIHNYVSRDASKSCQKLNGGINVDFAHSGPNFLVWHRTYLLILERALQRVLGNSSFGLPYWEWESNNHSVFDEQYFGTLSSTKGIKQDIINGLNWNTVCDITYRMKTATNKVAYWTEEDPSYCMQYWAPCNPITDLRKGNRLQRGNAETYLPNVREIQIAIAAPEYDAPDNNTYRQRSPRDSFRSRLEGWSLICSTSDPCVGPQVSPKFQRLHNNVHDWIDGHMSVPPSAVNDPVFSLHHSNIDRILESWMKRFPSGKIPSYVPDSGGHIGHNLHDYMVPFFPLITPNQQYSTSKNWGYMYDSLINATMDDKNISNCTINDEANIGKCRIYTADNQCVRNKIDGTYESCDASSSKMLKASLLLFLLIAFLTLVLED